VYEDLKVIPRFSASVVRGEKNRADGRNGAGKTTLRSRWFATHRIHRGQRPAFPIDAAK